MDGGSFCGIEGTEGRTVFAGGALLLLVLEVAIDEVRGGGS